MSMSGMVAMVMAMETKSVQILLLERFKVGGGPG